MLFNPLSSAGFCLSFIGFGRKLRPDSGTKQFGDLGNVNGRSFGVEQNYPAGTQDTIIVSKNCQLAILFLHEEMLALWMWSEGLVLGLPSCPLRASETRPFSPFWSAVGACVSSSLTVALSFGPEVRPASSLLSLSWPEVRPASPLAQALLASRFQNVLFLPQNGSRDTRSFPCL